MDISRIKDALKNFKCDIISQNEKEVVIKVEQKTVKLADVPDGSIFKIGKYEFIKLGTEENGVAALLKDFLYTDEFGKDNDYRTSYVREKINGEFLTELENEIGDECISTHNVPLWSLDGLLDYESVQDKVSLLTVDRYRKYRKHIPGYGKWWWLATPWSCKSNGYSSNVCYVCDSGALNGHVCVYSRGVRPFCIFSSSIFVSFE